MGTSHQEQTREWLDAEELEQLTGTAASTWRHFATKGIGPKSLKIGRRRVWKRIEIEQWLESQRD